MGWTVLYIAFGIVALWLLGEVLLQHKARLRWRLLAFAGFLGVVAGVLIPSVIVIGVGAAAFAVGQTYVTLSFRRGFSAGWALNVGKGTAKRRPEPVNAEPTLQVSGLEVSGADGSGPESVPGAPPVPAAVPAAAPEPPTYQPEPLPDEDTGGYAAYRDPAPEPGYAPYAAEQTGYADYGSYDSYGGYGAPAAGHDAPAGAGQDLLTGGVQGYADAAAGAGYPAPGDPGGYGYETDAGGYAVYSDPYGTGGQHNYPSYEPPYDPYGHQSYGHGTDDLYAAQDPYAVAQPYAAGPEGTGQDGLWVPQQRDGEPGQPAPDQHYPYQQGYPTGYDEQYRY